MEWRTRFLEKSLTNMPCMATETSPDVDEIEWENVCQEFNKQKMVKSYKLPVRR